ncbi:hypothetical protein CDIK_2106 [Cucumispora dikerogammari]|nr:hypothetical protein CDIK_2106 [Cucumispora dikerogammari]
MLSLMILSIFTINEDPIIDSDAKKFSINKDSDSSTLRPSLKEIPPIHNTADSQTYKNIQQINENPSPHTTNKKNIEDNLPISKTSSSKTSSKNKDSNNCEHDDDHVTVEKLNKLQRCLDRIHEISKTIQELMPQLLLACNSCRKKTSLKSETKFEENCNLTHITDSASDNIHSSRVKTDSKKESVHTEHLYNLSLVNSDEKNFINNEHLKVDEKVDKFGSVNSNTLQDIVVPQNVALPIHEAAGEKSNFKKTIVKNESLSTAL